MKNVQESGDKLLERCKEVEQLAVYNFVKEQMGNGKMIGAIINSFERGEFPLPGEIVKCVESYVNCSEKS